MAQRQDVAVELVSNVGIATGDPVIWPGGRCAVIVEATVFTSANLEIEGPNGTFVLVRALSAVGMTVDDIPPGRIRLDVTSGTAVYARAVRVPV